MPNGTAEAGTAEAVALGALWNPGNVYATPDTFNETEVEHLACTGATRLDAHKVAVDAMVAAEQDHVDRNAR